MGFGGGVLDLADPDGVALGSVGSSSSSDWSAQRCTMSWVY